jgi:hypothetical protein
MDSSTASKHDSNDFIEELGSKRRLIIVAWEQGFDIEIDYHPSADAFSLWEVEAALREALEEIKGQRIDAETEEAEDE